MVSRQQHTKKRQLSSFGRFRKRRRQQGSIGAVPPPSIPGSPLREPSSECVKGVWTFLVTTNFYIRCNFQKSSAMTSPSFYIDRVLTISRRLSRVMEKNRELPRRKSPTGSQHFVSFAGSCRTHCKPNTNMNKMNTQRPSSYEGVKAKFSRGSLYFLVLNTQRRGAPMFWSRHFRMVPEF